MDRNEFPEHPAAAGDATLDAASLFDALTRGDASEVRALLLAASGDGVASLLQMTDDQGRTALSFAAESGSGECVAELLQHGAAVDAVDNSGRTPLMFAVSAEVAEVLIKGGASVDATDEDGLAPLHRAASSNRVDVVAELLESGAAVDAVDNLGRNPLMCAASNELARKLIQSGARADVRGLEGLQWLHFAAGTNRVEIVRELLQSGVDADVKDYNGRTPLTYAESAEVAAALIKGGAQVNWDDGEIDGRDPPPLHHAVIADRVDVVAELLKSGAVVDAKDKNDRTPLTYATSKEMVDKLIQGGARTDVQGRYGFQWLHYAADAGSVEVVRDLLQRGFDVDVRNNSGQTPLMCAASAEVAAALITGGADVNAHEYDGGDDNEGREWTPLHHAVIADRVDVVIELLKNGALVDERCRSCVTPLMFAKSKEVVVKLIEGGADINARSCYGETALMAAVENGRVEVTAGLLSCGAEVDIRDDKGKTALSHAIDRRVSIDLVLKLLVHGADVNNADKLGKTPLMEAGRFTARLLKRGADINARDNDGRDALSWAAESNDAETVTTLLDRGANVHTKDNKGRSALSHAAEDLDVKIAAELIKRGVKVNEKDINGHSPLWHAAEAQGTARTLMDRIGKSENRRETKTPVKKLLRLGPLSSPDYTNDVVACFAAAAIGRPADIERLKRHLTNEKPVDTKTNDKKPVTMTDDEKLKHHLTNGMPVDTMTSDGRTLLFYAVERGNFDIVKLLLEHGASVNLTANDPSRPSRGGDTPLTIAGHAGHMEVFRQLLDHGASANARGDSGETPLISLARYGNFSDVQQLIEKGGVLCFEDVKEHEYPLIPGTLETMRTMCDGIFEFKTVCGRVLDRLDGVCSDLQQQQQQQQQRSRSESVKDSLLVPFARILSRFCHLVLDIKRRHRPLERLIASRAVLSKVEAFHEELDYFSEQLPKNGDSTSEVIRGWSTQLEDDQTEILSRLAQTLSSDEAVVTGLANDEQYGDSALRLQYEIIMHSREGDLKALQVVSEVQERLLRASAIQAPEVPEWFVSPDDVEFHGWNFTRSLFNYNWISSSTSDGKCKWYDGTWRKASVTIEKSADWWYKDPERNADRWYQLRHPNVVELLGACSIEDQRFYMFKMQPDVELLDEHLKKASDAADRDRKMWKCLYDVARGLWYLHSRGVVHGDVRNENIVVESNFADSKSTPVAKLCGLRPFSCNTTENEYELRWMAPETPDILTLDPNEPPKIELSTKSDIYAFGKFIWEAVIGKAPKYQAIKSKRPRGMDEAVWDLITKMCADDPDEREKIKYVVARLQLFEHQSRAQNLRGEGVDTLEGFKFPLLGATIPEELDTVRKLCASNGAPWMQDKVLPAVEDIFTLLQERSKTATDVEVALFVDTLALFRRYLKTAVSDKSVFRQVRSRQVAESHGVVYKKLDRLLDMMEVSEDDPVRKWRRVPAAATSEDEGAQGGVNGDNDFRSRQVVDSDDGATGQPFIHEDAVKLTYFPLASVNHAAWTRDGITAAVTSAATPPSWQIAREELEFSEVNEIGHGAFGAVYHDLWLDTPVVVKHMGYEKEKDEKDVTSISTDLLLHEVRVWHRLNHPNVLKLYGANHVDKRYFVCEFAGNGNLNTYLKKPGNENKVWQKLYEVALGLEYLHETHFVAHNDLKCDNIMVGSDDKAKLIDFGLSALVNEAEVQIDVKNIGAVQWRSPEYLAGERPSFASDVYSFAMCIIECVSGVHPWGPKANRPKDIVIKRKVTREKKIPPMPEAMNEKQKNLVVLMTKFNPSERVKMGYVANKLREFAEDEKLGSAVAKAHEIKEDDAS